jgi:hypothetical protein
MSAIYAFAKASMLGASPAINLTTGTIKAALVTASYTPNTASGGDQYWSVASANAVGTPQQITSPTVTGGVFNGAGVTYTSVAAGAAATQIVIYQDTGTTTTSPLIAVITAGTGLPVTPNGGNISITWDTGANKIFAL